MRSRIEIAEQLLGARLEDGQYAPCPGSDLHSGKSGRRDFRVVLDGAPTAYCFHGSCLNIIDEFNRKLRREIWFEENGRNPAPKGSWGEQVAAAPKSQAKARPEIDEYLVWEAVRGVPRVDEDWLKRRSPVDVAGLTSGDFLDHLYGEGERVLVFTSQMSQGDFLWWRGRGGFRLARERGVKATKSALPSGAPEGVWFLSQPVTGEWVVNPSVKWDPEEKTREVRGRYTRRSQPNVTSFRYFVLESDEMDAATWLRVLAGLNFPIVAIYTSGGRSVHALVRWEVSGKAEWDAIRNMLRQIVCPLGADPAALTAVRLSRLPGCRRGNRLQELLFLNPAATADQPIMMMPEVRS